jgi:hypothetical protein
LRWIARWISEPSGKFPNFFHFPWHYNKLHDYLRDRWNVQCPKSVAIRRDISRWNRPSPDSLSELYPVYPVGGQKTLACHRSGPILKRWSLTKFAERL